MRNTVDAKIPYYKKVVQFANVFNNFWKIDEGKHDIRFYNNAQNRNLRILKRNIATNLINWNRRLQLVSTLSQNRITRGWDFPFQVEPGFIIGKHKKICFNQKDRLQ